MRRLLTSVAFGALLLVGTGAAVSADTDNQENYPANPNACVGNSSTTANSVYDDVDPSKLRSTQARQEDGQPGRADSVAEIPQCVAAELDRGHIAGD